MTRYLTAILVVALAACSDTVTEPQLSLHSCVESAPLYGTPDARIPDRYIVVFHEGTNAIEAAAELAERFGFAPTSVWNSIVLRGFAARMSAAAVAGVRCDPRVAFVEYDQVVKLGI